MAIHCGDDQFEGLVERRGYVYRIGTLSEVWEDSVQLQDLLHVPRVVVGRRRWTNLVEEGQ